MKINLIIQCQKLHLQLPITIYPFQGWETFNFIYTPASKICLPKRPSIF